jgi:hypothetical protein
MLRLALCLLVAQDAGALPPGLDLRAPAPSALAGPVYRLQPAKDGGYVYEGGTFDAIVASDGEVRFVRGGTAFAMLLPLPLALPAGVPTLQGAVMGLLGKRDVRSAGAVSATEGNDAVLQGLGPAPMAPYSSLMRARNRPHTGDLCEDPSARCYFDSRALFVGGGTIDVTDLFLRLVGDDPYRYEKARFLAATAPVRGKLRDRVRARTLARALAQLPSTLEAIWTEPGASAAERRARVVAIADEAAGQPGEAQVRAAVQAFLRRKGAIDLVPAGDGGR